MSNKLISNFNIDKLQESALAVTITANDNYLAVYPEFIDYFNKLNTINKHNIVIGISFVYSWMPTILDFRQTEIDDVVNVLNSAKNGIRPSISDLSTLKYCFNNSLVGSSKLLHFINPDLFAIWDSRVYRSLFNANPHPYRVENPQTYIDYLSYCDEISNHQDSNNVRRIIELKVGYKISKMRSIELVHFYNGQRKLN